MTMIRDLLDNPYTLVVSLLAIAVVVKFQTLVRIHRWVHATLHWKSLLATNSSDESDIRVSGIFVHPVKSLRSISLKESTLDRKGLTMDRRFMVVYELPLPVYRTKWEAGDTTHRFLTQRQCPSLATITATIVTKNQRQILVLQQASKTIEIPLSSSTTTTYLAGIWDDVVAVDDMGDAAAAFLQDIVHADKELSVNPKTVRLVTGSSKPSPSLGVDERSYVPSYAKTVTGGFLGKPTLTDGFPILIASETSLQALNEKLKDNQQDPIPMSRFRPNIVVKGNDLAPFEEDTWKVIAIGATVFAIVKACPRCKQSCTDQTTGSVSSEPLATMASFRRSQGDLPSNGSVFFAQNAIPIGRLDDKIIKVGDGVRILERGDPVYID